MHEHQQKFTEQVTEMLNELEHSLLIFEKNPDDLTLIGGIFRTMHTIKGSAGMFGLSYIVELSHKIESIYSNIQKGNIRSDERIIDVTFRSADIILKLLHAGSSPDKKLLKEYEFLTEEINEFLTDDAPKVQHEVEKSALNFFFIRFFPDDDIDERGINLRAIFNKLGDLGHIRMIPKAVFEPGKYPTQWEIYLATTHNSDDIEELMMFVDMETEIARIADHDLLIDLSFVTEIEKHADDGKLLTQSEVVEIIAGLEASQRKASGAMPDIKHNTKATLRVDADKLDDLMRHVSELITLKSELLLVSSQMSDNRLTEIAEKLDKISGNIRNDMFEIRLISLESIRVNVERLIRDTAVMLKKEVQFTSEGMTTELDKTIVEKLTTPLMHIIRNSIDHGVEPANIRAQRNKTSHGNIKLKAWQSGSFVNIQVTDDGNGIDTDKIYKKAVEKKIISPAAVLSYKEIYDLMFEPGLSTAVQLSEVSGRGVGMDVVKNEIIAMRGDIIVESTPKVGTSVTLRLPVSLSIIDTLLIRAANMHFSIPIEEIIMVELVPRNILDENANRYVQIQSELLPYISLRTAFALTENRPDMEIAIVIAKENKKGVIIADKVIGEYQAVLKPLGEAFRTKHFLLGGSVMADGNISYIIDTSKLTETYK